MEFIAPAGNSTIDTRSNFLNINYAGGIILLVLLIGGGTGQYSWADHLLQVVLIPAIFLGLTRLRQANLDRGSKILIALILAVLLLQFVPFGFNRSLPTFPGFPEGGLFWSLTPSKSLEAALSAVATIGFFLFVANLQTIQQEKLVRFLFLGLAINVLVGIVQLSFGQRVTLDGLLPFRISSALFGNENHFSSFVFAMIPLLAWRYLVVLNKPLIYTLVTVGLVALLFAVSSRAGMAMSVVLAVLSFIWAKTRHRLGRINPWLVTVLVLLSLIAITVMIGKSEVVDGDVRPVMFTNTWNAIKQHWLFGTGLGSFLFVYPMYEPLKDVTYAYVNRAHNEYLELFLELGIVFLPLLVFFIYQIARAMFRSALTEAATLSLFALLLHSSVDYPLRTSALAIVFAYLSAVILSRPKDGAENTQQLNQKIHSGMTRFNY